MNLKHTTGALLAFGLLSTAAFAATAPTPAQAFDDSCTPEHLGGGVWQIVSTQDCTPQIPAGAKKLSAVLVGSGGGGGKGADWGDSSGGGAAGGVTYWQHSGAIAAPLELELNFISDWGDDHGTTLLLIDGDVAAEARAGLWSNEDPIVTCSAGADAVTRVPVVDDDGNPVYGPNGYRVYEVTCGGGTWQGHDAVGPTSGAPTSHSGKTSPGRLPYYTTVETDQGWTSYDPERLLDTVFIPALPSALPTRAGGAGGASGAADGDQGGPGIASFTEVGANSLWPNSSWSDAFDSDDPIAVGGSAGSSAWHHRNDGWGSGANEDENSSREGNPGIAVIRYELNPSMGIVNVRPQWAGRWGWDVQKTASMDSTTAELGDPVDVTVTVTPALDDTIAEFEVHGDVVVDNPTESPITLGAASVVFSVPEDTPITGAYCPLSTNGATVQPGGQYTRWFSCYAHGSWPAGTNAKVDVTIPVAGGDPITTSTVVDLAGVDPYYNTDERAYVRDTADEFGASLVDDPNWEEWASAIQLDADAGARTFNYVRTLEASSVPGECLPFPNTVTVYGSGEGPDWTRPLDSDSADVEVCTDLLPPTGTLDVRPSYYRHVDWSLDKAVDQGFAQIPVAGEAEFEYTLTATRSAIQNRTFRVYGSLAVNNPNPEQITLTDGTVTLTGITGATCQVTSSLPYNLGAGLNATVWYSCQLPDTTSPTAAGTVTFVVNSTSGTITETKSVDFATITGNWTMESSPVLHDSAPQFADNGGWIKYLDPELPVITYTYTRFIDADDADLGAGECEAFPNVAWLKADEPNFFAALPDYAPDQDSLPDGWWDEEEVEVCVGSRSWTMSKASDPVSTSTVATGTDITYTLTATNTGDFPLDGLVARDDMTRVLDNAIIKGALPAGLTQSGTSLVWTIPSLAAAGTAGDSVSVSYTVTVDPTAFNVRLTNSVYGDPGTTGNPPPAACYQESPCSTWHETPVFPTPPNLPLLGSTSMAVLLTTGGLLLAAAVAVAVYRRRHTPAVAGLSDPDSAPVDSDTHTQN